MHGTARASWMRGSNLLEPEPELLFIQLHQEDLAEILSLDHHLPCFFAKLQIGRAHV